MAQSKYSVPQKSVAQILQDQRGVTKTIAHGSNLDVDLVAEQMVSISFACKNGACIKAGSSNTGIVYVGLAGVTAGTEPNTDGFPLSAGDSVSIEVMDVNLIYVIASAVNQKVFWIAS